MQAKTEESISIQFFGDFLNINATSSQVLEQKRDLSRSLEKDLSQLMKGPELRKWEWRRSDIPKLFSPINKTKLIKQRRLLCLIQKHTIVNGQIQQAETIGQVSLKLNAMEKVEMVGMGIRPSLYLRLNDFPVTLQNKVVGKLNGRFKCQFTTEQELKNDLLQAQQQEAIRKAKRDSQF